MNIKQLRVMYKAGFSGKKRDSAGREQCYQDGEHVACGNGSEGPKSKPKNKPSSIPIQSSAQATDTAQFIGLKAPTPKLIYTDGKEHKKEYHKLFKPMESIYEGYEAGSNKEAFKALYNYTRSNEVTGFERVNKDLRSGKQSKQAELMMELAEPFSELNKKVKAKGIVYRGVTSLSATGLDKSDEFVEKGMLSTSFDPMEANDFAVTLDNLGRPKGQPAILRMYPSSSLKAVVGASYQKELVFQPGTKLQVVKRSEVSVIHPDSNHNDPNPKKIKVVVLDVLVTKAEGNS